MIPLNPRITLEQLNNFCIENNIDIIVSNGEGYWDVEVKEVKEDG